MQILIICLAVLWTGTLACIGFMRKYFPENSRGYTIYAISICVMTTIFEVLCKCQS